MPKDKILCDCGDTISAGYQAYHEKGWWHQNYQAARDLRDRGLSFAEIARQLGSTRVYVRIKLLGVKVPV